MIQGSTNKEAWLIIRGRIDRREGCGGVQRSKSERAGEKLFSRSGAAVCSKRLVSLSYGCGLKHKPVLLRNLSRQAHLQTFEVHAEIPRVGLISVEGVVRPWRGGLSQSLHGQNAAVCV